MSLNKVVNTFKTFGNQKLIYKIKYVDRSKIKIKNLKKQIITNNNLNKKYFISSRYL